MPTPAEILAAMSGSKLPAPAASKLPQPMPKIVRNYKVTAGHDSCVVRGTDEESAKANFFQKMGIRSTKHTVEIVEVGPAK